MARLSEPGERDRGSRKRILPVLLAASLLAHVGLILPLLLSSHEDGAAPRETAVEVVQLPAPQQPPAGHKPPPAPAPSNPAPTKPAPVKTPPPQEHHSHPPTKPSVTDRLEKLIGPMPALALPSSSDTGSDNISYRESVLSQVSRAKKDGKHQGIPGAASVSFSLGDHGEVVRCEIARKSVDPALDAEAIAMVRRGAPYPPPPPGADRDYVITLRFRAL